MTISAWDQLKLDQERRITDRLIAKAEARAKREELEASLRRRIQVHRDHSSLERYAADERQRIHEMIHGDKTSLMTKIGRWFRAA
ncbi:hypothetical protein EOS93_23155 [Rhizobium sp. RMa-01]|uniref:hypothetical protein n=1 Tax=unclassified Rhizobium TaxID=2613769 RepID=UPI0008D9D63D|nr:MULTISPECIES: hypothetical protein [unclassified Rhizobium]OHV21430.1 hypothetical protein BBJ66_31200 [Rhizobium sp. RSm-3]RVU08812.1 hypothetical protein EOS93_23155 [Rhizobium sp. RMa-01]